MTTYYEKNKEKIAQKYQDKKELMRDKYLEQYYKSSFLILCPCGDIIRHNYKSKHEKTDYHIINMRKYKGITPPETIPIDLNNFDTYKEGFITYFSKNSKKTCAYCECGLFITDTQFLNRHYNSKKHKDFIERQKRIIIDLEELD